LLYPLIHGSDLVHVVDIKDDEFYRSGNQQRRALVDVGGARTVLEVALRKDGKLLGAIIVFRLEVRPFSDKQIALLQTFAAQAVIAMENARLINETRETLEQQTATSEVLQVINASPGDLAPVFEAMLERAMRLCNAAFGVLFLTDGDVVRAKGSRSVPPAFRDYLERDPPRLDAASLLGHSMRERIVLNVADLRETAPYRNRVPLSVAAVELGDIRSICWVPLVHETSALGLFAIFRQEVRPFTVKQIALLENFAAQAVIAMENARLITETREALEQQTATAEVLQVINASPGDLVPVFDTMLQKATELCAAAFGIFWTFDGEHYHAVAFRNVPPPIRNFCAIRHPPPH
jgi:GAF domain-containing protein